LLLDRSYRSPRIACQRRTGERELHRRRGSRKPPGCSTSRRAGGQATLARRRVETLIQPASSAQTSRHRLNRGGSRRLNHALHMMALTQARMDPRARGYVERRSAKAAPAATPSGRSSATSPTSSTQQLRHDAALLEAAAPAN
jgi:hypothetical protein